MKSIVTVLAVLLMAGTSLAQATHDPAHSHGDTQIKSSVSDSDQLRIAVQQICPVMGAKLGSMGAPIKVQLNGETVFLCCDGCKSKKINTQHWKTIQTRIAKAQASCPIMGKPVTTEMESTVVKGQRVFVCCPPCISKIEKDVSGSLAKVNANYVKFVSAESNKNSDSILIGAQKICPISGEKLGSMGTPVKIKVGKQHVFICCNGCKTKKISGTHWKTVQSNLASAQGVCPIMKKPVTSDMKSTIVNGRKIFVCCPPCIKKIEKDPAKYVRQLDVMYSASARRPVDH